MLHLAHFDTKGGLRTFAAVANLMGHTPEADLQWAATTHFPSVLLKLLHANAPVYPVSCILSSTLMISDRAEEISNLLKISWWDHLIRFQQLFRPPAREGQRRRILDDRNRRHLIRLHRGNN
jgi:hypothetical protein